MKNFEQSGLDILFFGQEHYDTMAILQQRAEIDQDEFKSGMLSQKILNNKDLLLKNFKEVIENLKDCNTYIENVIVSNTPY